MVKTNANTKIYMENLKEKNHEERESERFHYNADDYNGVSLMC